MNTPGDNLVCSHLDQVREVTPDSPDSCPECLELGDSWVHLRECQICGHVGCCDSSKNKHATAHHESSGHPLIRSYEPGERWWWCYEDLVTFEVEGVDPARAA
ncbi:MULTISPECIES: UBP-type zinc finger domain-containing protein [Streptomyces]|uniref:Sodium/hydrogen exchanger n=2 Tax=Streptomyces TaxID=1883 RepID=A0A0B5EPU0_STRA4|nr:MULTISPECIES: UBP-type zinc finger domain-containing protein [Streptomyces]AJE81290.1 sodium/hydrogen exchanger [Streptomyces albus]AOU75605.1 sodium/hydrogen exchanger [Streptomyces albus]AYN31410.1 zinc finger UBP-type protein [Streptomyces albus]NKI44270.1 UBP-type zinc finger domain-containing protein [Streptomyces physcomitrii]